MERITIQLDQIIASQMTMLELLTLMQEEAKRQHEELMQLLKGDDQ